MAAGRPFVATARPGSMLWKLMERSSAFFCVPSGDVAALTDGVKRLAGDPALCRQLGLKGRSYVVKHHDKKAVLDRFFAALRAGKPIRVESSGEHAASLDL
jgi:colanic acid biosynthesis glycosyl transferase WcaI